MPPQGQYVIFWDDVGQCRTLSGNVCHQINVFCDCRSSQSRVRIALLSCESAIFLLFTDLQTPEAKLTNP